jgi:hypothetical protein
MQIPGANDCAPSQNETQRYELGADRYYLNPWHRSTHCGCLIPMNHPATLRRFDRVKRNRCEPATAIVLPA